MSSAVEPRADYDLTDVPSIVLGSVKLGLFESAAVLLFALVSRHLDGPIEWILEALILFPALLVVTVLPGLWTRPRTIEGIAGAAGIGLAAAWVFLLVDVVLLQPIGTYTFRWLAIGGGSNWWYHPVWWMVGTYLPWFGAWILANHAVRRGETSVGGLALSALVFTALAATLGIFLQVPRAGWNLPTFGVAFAPGLALALLFSSLGGRRG